MIAGVMWSVTLQMMVMSAMLANNIMPMQYYFYTHFTEMGYIGEVYFLEGGDNFLGSALRGEILYLGYSLPQRKFPGGGSVL